MVVLFHGNVHASIIAANDNYPSKVFQKLFPMVHPAPSILYEKRFNKKMTRSTNTLYKVPQKEVTPHTMGEKN